MINNCKYTTDGLQTTKWGGIFAAVCADIKAGKFLPGSSFYTVRELARAYGVSDITGRRVFQELKSQRLIVTDGRRGTFLAGAGTAVPRKVFLCLPDELLGADIRTTHFSRIYHEIMMGFAESVGADAMQLAPVSLNFLLAHGKRFKNQDLLVGAEALLEVSADRVSVNHELLKRLQAMFNPVVLRGIAGIEGVSQVSIDYRAGFFAMVSHLLASGRRRLACICGRTSSPWFQPRFQGYLDALHAHGLAFDPQLLKITSGSQAEDSAAVGDLLAASARPDAIVCANDQRALNVLEYCRRQGVRVPDEIAVSGFDDIHEAELSQPGLTTMNPRIRSVAREALNILRQRHAGNRREPANLMIAPELVIRQSA